MRRVVIPMSPETGSTRGQRRLSQERSGLHFDMVAALVQCKGNGRRLCLIVSREVGTSSIEV
jgi:hypothetical protein